MLVKVNGKKRSNVKAARDLRRLSMRRFVSGGGRHRVVWISRSMTRRMQSHVTACAINSEGNQRQTLIKERGRTLVVEPLSRLPRLRVILRRQAGVFPSWFIKASCTIKNVTTGISGVSVRVPGLYKWRKHRLKSFASAQNHRLRPLPTTKSVAGSYHFR